MYGMLPLCVLLCVCVRWLCMRVCMLRWAQLAPKAGAFASDATCLRGEPATAGSPCVWACVLRPCVFVWVWAWGCVLRLAHLALHSALAADPAHA
jgi:hypothetical protein